MKANVDLESKLNTEAVLIRAKLGAVDSDLTLILIFHTER